MKKIHKPSEVALKIGRLIAALRWVAREVELKA
jgi:hypothetical protein